MKLNHLNLPVQDVTSARSFFEKHLNFTSIDVKPNETLSVLKGEDDFTLVLMNEKMNEHGNTAYPDAFHIGFFLKDAAEVDALYARLKEDGTNVGEAPQQIRKTYGFYFYMQKILIEIAA